MMLIWFYLAICCDVPKHRGELGKHTEERRPPSLLRERQTSDQGAYKAENWSTMVQRTVQNFLL